MATSFENSDRKFTRAIGLHFLTIQITTIGDLFGRATSLGDRRLLFKILDRRFARAIGRHFLAIQITTIGSLFGRHFVAISVPEM